MNPDWIQDLCGIILDMDGVLWKEDQPLGDLPAAFGMIRKQGWQIMGMTNNSTRTPDHYLDRLRKFGVELQPGQVINSSEATAHYLYDRFPEGGAVFMIGEEGLRTALEQKGFKSYQTEVPETEPVAVVAGMDRELTYLKIETAARYIRGGSLFIGTNPDKTYPTPEGLSPGAGVVLAAVEAASGQAPLVMGKPHKRMYQTVLERMGCEPARVLVVGDRLETDILGAQEIGCKSALVLSGISSREDVREWSPQPDMIAENINRLFVELLDYE